jgi:hypothetical protein
VGVADPWNWATFMLESRAAEPRSPWFGISFLLPIGTLVTLALVIEGVFVLYIASEQD